VNSGGRRRPPGPRLRGLGCVVLLIAVLSLWLGAQPGHSPHATEGSPGVTHSVATPLVAARPSADDAVPAPAIELTVLLGLLLVVVGAARAPVAVRSRRHRTRAPPPGLSTF
jgi:hypothetical protein